MFSDCSQLWVTKILQSETTSTSRGLPSRGREVWCGFGSPPLRVAGLPPAHRSEERCNSSQVKAEEWERTGFTLFYFILIVIRFDFVRK